MLLETFRGRRPRDILIEARATLGEDTWVVRTRPLARSGGTEIEMVVATAAALPDLHARLEEPLPTWPDRESSRQRPHVVALVGPTGSGKTTTAVKLAVHPEAYGAGRPGLLCLDTFRVAAVEQLGSYAEAAGLPMEVVYGSDELERSLHRLSACDAILVDTPGRAPGDRAAHTECARMLRRLAPDEVHLVLPAYLAREAAEHLVETYSTYGPTHLLASKLDETPDQAAAALMALRSRLRSRWVTDGQSVPTDLRSARTTVLASLGIRIPEASPEGRVA